jgi:hypothetical protein
MRTRLRRLVSLWRKPREQTARPAVTDEVAVRDDEVEQSQSGGDPDRRLTDAQARLKRAVPPKQD